MSIIENSTERRLYHYAVYMYSDVMDDKVQREYPLIVLKNEYGVIVYFTCLHKYIRSYSNSAYRPVTSNASTKMKYICRMLNYVVIENYEKYGVNHIFQINKAMLLDFFSDYAAGIKKDGKHRDRQSIEKCLNAIREFIKCLNRKFEGYMSVSYEELFKVETVSMNNGRKKLVRRPDFQIEVYDEHREVFRDIPTQVVAIIIEQSLSFMPEIAFAICLQAFAGLRPGEVCNVRREDSVLGRGISITEIDGRAVKTEIDLTKEYCLRSDRVTCGKIKKERRQGVYPAFLDAFMHVYKLHLKYIDDKKYEHEYGPLFVERNGKAMTYEYYAKHFQKLMTEYVRPILLKHSDPECRLYGQMLYEKKLGLHAFRHWFSVQLVLHGEDIAQVQFWRGDSNPESALTYLMNKGELVRRLSEANNIFAKIVTQYGEQSYDEK